jgi:hypothetical protein
VIVPSSEGNYQTLSEQGLVLHLLILHRPRPQNPSSKNRFHETQRAGARSLHFANVSLIDPGSLRAITYVLTLIQRLPSSATTSTLAAAGRGVPRWRGSGLSVVAKGINLKTESIEADANKTSFHTAIRYGAFVDGGARWADSGSSRNY